MKSHNIEPQEKQNEWHEQWMLFQDEERFLFDEWISPIVLEDFRGKTVLECGCGRRTAHILHSTVSSPGSGC